MNKEDLIKRVAHLESVNDMLLTELGYVDHLMRMVGFAEGVTTVKATARELSRADDADASPEI